MTNRKDSETDRNIDELFIKILDEVQDVGKNIGAFSVGELEERLSVFRGFFRKIRHRKRLPLAQLMEILEVLEIEPHHVFQRAFGRPRTLNDALDGLARLARPFVVDHLHGEDLYNLDVDGGTPLTEEDRLQLEEIDQQTFDSPQEAVEKAQVFYQKILERRHLPSAIRSAAVWSSSLRFVRFGASMALSSRALNRTVNLPVSAEKHLLLSDLMRRADYLAGDLGDLGLASILADMSIVQSALGGDVSGVGKGLTVRGTFAAYGKDETLANKSLTAALSFLSGEKNSDKNYILAALFNLAFSYCVVGEYQQARKCLGRIGRRSDPPDLAPHFLSRFHWLQAMLHQADREYEKADDEYLKSYEIFLRSSFPADAACVCTDAIVCAEQTNDKEKILRWADCLSWLSEKLEDGVWEQVLRRAIQQAGNKRDDVTRLLTQVNRDRSSR